MAKRKGISKRVRFEVFKRDSFKCQYCGKMAPDVILQVDHIDPVSRGGKSDILNLVTSCVDCNSGKSDVPLGDDAAIRKQQAQLAELNERREQLEMMVKWRAGLSQITDRSVDAAHDAWRLAAKGWHFNERGLAGLRKNIAQFGLDKVLRAIETARTQYLIPDAQGKLTQEQVSWASSKLGGICKMMDSPEWKRRLYYIRGILKNKFDITPYRGSQIMSKMEEAVSLGVDVEYIKRLALDAQWIRRFEDWLDETIAEARADG